MMIVLILLSICVYSNGKSLSSSQSQPLPGADDKAIPSDTLKRPVVDDFEDFPMPFPPQPRTVYHIDFTKENGTEIVAKRPTILEVIPADYICDFCVAVIKKLKERQSTEANFEE
ncbi:hypothetical protein GCK32_013708, partial [Trichostrongylus colubriformis]